MPTVVIAGFRFRFYSSDRAEPPHMHVIHGEKVAKIWLMPVAVEHNHGYSRVELNKIIRLAEEHREMLLENWYEYFGR